MSHLDALSKNGLSHFMDLEVRTDILAQPVEDPLIISGPEAFETLEWGKVKQEVPEDVQISHVKFTDVTSIEKRAQSITCEMQTYTQPIAPCFDIDNDHSECDNQVNLEHLECNIMKSDNNNAESALNGSNNWTSEPSPNGIPKEETKSRRRGLPQACDVCQKKLSSKSSLRLHMLKKHKIKLHFSCELCSSKFDLQRELINHRKTEHRTENGKFICDKCGRSLVDYQNFLLHIKSHHDSSEVLERTKGYDEELGIQTTLKEKFKQQEKNFTCDTCGKRFAFNCLLRDHINLHTGAKPYLCSTCGRSFSQKASLKQHARTHNAIRPHKCPDCPQGFFERGDLKKHMRKHTGERPYVCEMCGEGFSQSSHLGIHRRSHTGERPYRCDICSRGFTKKGDVRRHRRIHTGELPYLCQVCGKTFRQSTQCANHIKNHHPECPVPVARNPTPAVNDYAMDQSLVHTSL